MSKNLVIVESPSKSKTIEKYLGKDYKVLSSKGHIRDLAIKGKGGLGVDIENGFEPTYVPIKEKAGVIKELNKAAKDAKKVYLATDPDREGEAISWHLKEVLNLSDNEYERVVFNELTETAIKNGFLNPRKIDNSLVRSQETRRILDRIIGFRLSNLLQRKIKSKSAGRVQSVALKLIVDREREIEAFVPEEYWEIISIFPEFESKLEKHNNKKIKIKTEEEANKILNDLSNTYKVLSIEQKETKRKPKPAFITSTLQQEASNKLNFKSKKTMQIAQKLYEGVDLEKETVGLITYMRTDSTRLSDEFIKDAKAYIEQKFGKEYVGTYQHGKKKENVQDAHEAIRPTSIKRTPESVKQYLKPDEYKLYKLIYERAIASLMKEAKLKKVTIILENNNYQFKATGQTLIFDGYLKLYYDYEKSEEKLLPPLEVNSTLENIDIKAKQLFTTPKSRYTEASLIKEMEELGIGRPSTYAITIETILERGYVTLENKKFVPTGRGIITNDKLQEFFSDIINVKYTAEMETYLDLISRGELVWNSVLCEFYQKFSPLVDKAFKEMEKLAPKETGELCPECGSMLVERVGRYGKFIACSNYPNCKYIKPEEKTKAKEICDCPKCDGKIIEKKTKRGKIFYGCNNFPKCTYALWDEPTGEKCIECGSMLVKKNGKIYCSNCKNEQS